MDFEQIYKEYFSDVYKYIVSISYDPYTAEEITQETFFKAIDKIDSFRGETSIRIWLCQIAKHLYFDHCKKRARYTELPEESAETTDAMEEKIFEQQDIRRLHKILHNLKEPYKEVFSLRTFGELSFSDIAELFARTDSWARVTYYRAKLMIRKEMENE